MGMLLDAIRDKVGLTPREAAMPTAKEATADLAEAREALRLARDRVQAAVALWPEGARDRRWIETAVAAQPRLAVVHPNEPQRGHDRNAAFRLATEAEQTAIIAVERAEAVLTQVGRATASSGARDAIRAALEDIRAAESETAKVQAMVDRARAHVASMTDRHHRAVDAVEQARIRRVEAVTTSAASGGEIAPDRTLSKARAALTESEDDLAAASDALAALAPTLDDPARAERTARERLAKAADIVLVGHVAGIQPVVMGAARQHFKVGAAAGYLASRFDPYDSDHQTRLAAQSFAGRHTIMADLDPAEAARLRAEAIGPWEAYREALLRDPEAQPPEVT